MFARLTRGQSSSTVAIVVAGVIFGSAFLCTKILVGEMRIAHFVTLRLLLGAVAVTAFMLIRRRPPRLSRALLRYATVLALADAVIPYFLVSWGQTRINAGTAAVLVSTMPLFTALFAWLLSRDESLSLPKLLGLATGLAGVAVIAGSDSAGGLATPSAGSGAVVLAAMLYAAAAVYARRALKQFDAATLNASKLAVGALIVLPFAASADGAHALSGLDLRGVIALLWIGMMATGLARVAYFRAVAVAGSVRASLVTYIVPVSGVTLAYIVLGEPVHPRSVAGFGLVIAGVALVMYGGGLRHLAARLATPVRRSAGAPPATIAEGR